MFFFFSSRRRHTRCSRDWSSDVCSSDLCPCPGLDQHFESSLDEIRDHHGNERNASLARITLLRHSNDHGVILLSGSMKSYKDPPRIGHMDSIRKSHKTPPGENVTKSSGNQGSCS